MPLLVSVLVINSMLFAFKLDVRNTDETHVYDKKHEPTRGQVDISHSHVHSCCTNDKISAFALACQRLKSYSSHPA